MKKWRFNHRGIIFTALLKKAQSTFTLLAFYQDEFSDTHYDIETDKFIIDDNEAFICRLYVEQKQNEREVA